MNIQKFEILAKVEGAVAKGAAAGATQYVDITLPPCRTHAVGTKFELCLRFASGTRMMAPAASTQVVQIK